MRTAVMVAAVAATVAFASTVLAADLEVGKKVFSQKCASCHGPDGKGNPKMAAMLKVTLPDLTAGVNKTDAELTQLVTEGKKPMPSFKSLSKDEVDGVIHFVKSLGSGAVAGGKK